MNEIYYNNITLLLYEGNETRFIINISCLMQAERQCQLILSCGDYTLIPLHSLCELYLYMYQKLC